MKKVLFTILLSITSLSIVKADTIDIPMEFYDDTSSGNQYMFDHILVDALQTNSQYQQLLSCYNSSYASTYPYFFVRANETSPSNIIYDFFVSQTLPSSLVWYRSSYNNTWKYSIGFPMFYSNTNERFNTFYGISISEGCNIFSVNSSFTYIPVYDETQSNSIPFSSNFDLMLSSDSIGNYSGFNDVSLQFPFYTSSSYDLSFQYFELTSGDTLPTYMSLYNGSYSPSISYTEVNLNDYEYITLSLKDYSSSQPFTTNIITQGQLCLTPVYDYGMKEKQSTGYQVQSCSPYYDNFTPTQVYILEQDIKNHAIYYLKAYDTSKINKVKIDTNIFNITYITSQNANNPTVIIGGRSYPTIPYNDLSSTATQSYEEGYISGQVENVFDVSSDSNFISNLFSNPLQTLGSVWTSIITFFALIGSFIGLLPNTMQTFLYTSFSLGLVLGLIKILISS